MFADVQTIRETEQCPLTTSRGRWCSRLWFRRFVVSRSPQELLKTETPVEGDNLAPCETQTGDIRQMLEFGFVLVSTQRSLFSADIVSSFLVH